MESGSAEIQALPRQRGLSIDPTDSPTNEGDDPPENLLRVCLGNKKTRDNVKQAITTFRNITDLLNGSISIEQFLGDEESNDEESRNDPQIRLTNLESV
jgi:hypothetical protein